MADVDKHGIKIHLTGWVEVDTEHLSAEVQVELARRGAQARAGPRPWAGREGPDQVKGSTVAGSFRPAPNLRDALDQHVLKVFAALNGALRVSLLTPWSEREEAVRRPQAGAPQARPDDRRAPGAHDGVPQGDRGGPRSAGTGRAEDRDGARHRGRGRRHGGGRRPVVLSRASREARGPSHHAAEHGLHRSRESGRYPLGPGGSRRGHPSREGRGSRPHLLLPATARLRDARPDRVLGLRLSASTTTRSRHERARAADEPPPVHAAAIGPRPSPSPSCPAPSASASGSPSRGRNRVPGLLTPTARPVPWSATARYPPMPARWLHGPGRKGNDLRGQTGRVSRPGLRTEDTGAPRPRSSSACSSAGDPGDARSREPGGTIQVIGTPHDHRQGRDRAPVHPRPPDARRAKAHADWRYLRTKLEAAEIWLARAASRPRDPSRRRRARGVELRANAAIAREGK